MAHPCYTSLEALNSWWKVWRRELSRHTPKMPTELMSLLSVGSKLTIMVIWWYDLIFEIITAFMLACKIEIRKHDLDQSGVIDWMGWMKCAGFVCQMSMGNMSIIDCFRAYRTCLSYSHYGLDLCTIRFFLYLPFSLSLACTALWPLCSLCPELTHTWWLLY